MYLTLCIIGGIFMVLAIIAIALFILCGCEEPVCLAAFAICLVIAIPCVCGSESINEPYVAKIENGTLVISDIYEVDDGFVRIVADPNQSSSDWCAHGTRTIIVEVKPQEVLEIIMDTPAPSMNQLLVAERLAAECGVELPSSMFVPEA